MNITLVQRRLMPPTEAAKYIGFSPSTLAKWRHFGQGPEYVKITSKVFYETHVLDAFIDEGRRSSTSEATD